MPQPKERARGRARGLSQNGVVGLREGRTIGMLLSPLLNQGMRLEWSKLRWLDEMDLVGILPLSDSINKSMHK